MLVVQTAGITGRGLALFFEEEPDPIPMAYRLDVIITRPDGSAFETEAQREFARKVPPGEVVVFFLPGVEKSEVPVGSCVRVLSPVAA
ncbi:MAG TPA: hypothetical protein EYQ24_09560 [Bacteroidetes bacterium]|nr:hypothetical protein [Bacteroidota bacterium]HIL56762.1 hypothetical protein [Rhodothermales bacterium]